MKRLNTIINSIIGAFIGVFIGHGVYVVWNFKTRPELYAMQSAPWYTSILVYGAFTLVVLLICFAIKAIIKHKQKKKYANSDLTKECARMKKNIILIISVISAILLIGSFPLKLIAESIAVDICRLVGFILIFVVSALRISQKNQSINSDKQRK